MKTLEMNSNQKRQLRLFFFRPNNASLNGVAKNTNTAAYQQGVCEGKQITLLNANSIVILKSK
jgi:hypothetical protein